MMLVIKPGVLFFLTCRQGIVFIHLSVYPEQEHLAGMKQKV